MLVYDESLARLDDTYEGDEVSLLAVRGGRVDPEFVHNYGWATQAADLGKLKKIRVVVVINRESWVHTVGAVNAALAGGPLHRKAAFDVVVENLAHTSSEAKVREALAELTPKPLFEFTVSDAAEIAAAQKRVRVKPTPAEKPAE